MQIFLYRKGAERVEEGFSREELPDLLADNTNVVWVDLLGDTPEHIAEARDILLNVFNFYPTVVEDCLLPRRQPKIEGFRDYFYFVVHAVKPETSAANFATKELDGYLGSNFVVTFRGERFLSIKHVKEQVRASTFICERGAAYLLHQILDEIVDLYMPVIDDFDRSINRLEERVFEAQRTSNEALQDIMDVRRSVARLRRISARQLEVLYRMAHGEFPQIPEPMLPLFRDVHDHLIRIGDLSESYRDLVTGLFDVHLAVVGNRTNDIMKTLAIISAIMLPLTLIAGIYGMNFKNMPELESPYGYWLTLAAMALLAIGLLAYFWRLGWIFQPEEDLIVDERAQRDDIDMQDG